MNINELPPELLARIFSNIDDFSQKIELERVCSKWRFEIMPVNWKATKTCPKPLNNPKILGLVLNRCGQWLDELWLQNVRINENMVNQMARRMKCLKHLKLSQCELHGPSVNSIADSFGHQLCSFILDETGYHPNMRRFIESESSKLQNLSLYLRERNYSAGTLPTKLPNNLKSFSLHTGWNSGFYEDFLVLILNIAKDCKNLKILHLQIGTLLPNMILVIGNIKSLVYLSLDANIDKEENETELQNVICDELPNLKALNVSGRCSEETIATICRDRPDLVHLNVIVKNLYQFPDSLNSLAIRMEDNRYLPKVLFNQQNKSIQHLDIRSLVLPSSSNFIENLLGQFSNLKSIYCIMPVEDDYLSNADLTPYFHLFEKHLAKGRKITINFHDVNVDNQAYHKYIFPDDLSLIKKAGWSPNMCEGICENWVLKKLIREAIGGGNNPSFLDDLWME